MSCNMDFQAHLYQYFLLGEELYSFFYLRHSTIKTSFMSHLQAHIKRFEAGLLSNPDSLLFHKSDAADVSNLWGSFWYVRSALAGMTP